MMARFSEDTCSAPMGSAVRVEVLRPLIAGGPEQVSRLTRGTGLDFSNPVWEPGARSAVGLTGGTGLEKLTAQWKTLHPSVLRFGG